MPNALAVADAAALRRTVTKLPPAVAKPASVIGTAATGGALWGAFAAILAVLGRDGRRAAKAGAAAYGLASALANGPAKWAVRRPRPRGMLLAGLRRRGSRPRTSSFPSSHTASAFAFAVAVSTEYPPASPVVLTTAAAVALSRLRAVRHYPSDVLGGVVLGAAVGAGTAWALRRVSQRRAPASKPEEFVGV